MYDNDDLFSKVLVRYLAREHVCYAHKSVKNMNVAAMDQ